LDNENNVKDINSNKNDENISAPAQDNRMPSYTPISAQSEAAESMGNDCPTCKKNNSQESMAEQEPKFIYALGSVRVQFPNVTVEKEYRQLVREESTERLIEPQVVHKILKNNRYLAREVCWVFTIEGLDTYLLAPRDPLDLDQLTDALDRPNGEELDTDVIIGERGPVAPIDRCGLELPIVLFDKIYSFQKKELIKEIPKPESTEEAAFRVSSDGLFESIQQLSDNAGASDDHRALNYLAVRYPQIYIHTTEMHNQDYSLDSVETRPSRLSGTRKLIDVIFSYQNRKSTVIDKYYVRVDVTGKYPFLENPLSRYFDRT